MFRSIAKQRTPFKCSLGSFIPEFEMTFSLGKQRAHVWNRSVGKGYARLFRPMYAEARGTRPEPKGSSSEMKAEVRTCGIPHLAKNERDVGHPGFGGNWNS